MRKRWLIIVISVLTVVTVVVSAQEKQTLTVFAASSLTDAFEEIATAFEAENTEVDVVYNFGGSSTLSAQLVEGAPADIFASANISQMNVARDAGRIAGNPRTFAKNRLVMIVPRDNPANITSLRDLANDGVQLIIAAPDVPVRTYTDTMLQLLAVNAAYGEAYSTAVMANVVSEEENVRQVSAKVALGEADAGIVYISDVTPDVNDLVMTIPIPDYLNTIAAYPIAITDDTTHPELAQAFVDFVLSDAGQDILVEWNFISVCIPEVPYTVTLPQGTSAFTVDGQVLNPITLTVEDLRNSFSSETIDVSYQSGEDMVSATFTGVPLWLVIGAAQPNLNADIPSDRLSMFVVVTTSDHVQVVIAWGEIDPELANQPILIAYEENGTPIADDEGSIRLIVPGDTHDGRYVRGVANISLRDAPTVDQ